MLAKNNSFLFLISSLFIIFSSSKPTESEIVIEKKVRPLLIEYTSTGCPGCGSWGNPTFKELSKKYKGKVSPIAAHIKYGDPMITKISEELAENRLGRRYTPQIAVNRENAVVIRGSIDHNASLKKADALIKKYASVSAPYIGGSKTISEDQLLKFKYKIDLNSYSEEVKDLLISVYLLEDELYHRQSGAEVKKEVHHRVIKEAFQSSTFGELILKVKPNDKEAFDYEGSFDLKKSNTKAENASVILVIWKRATDGGFSPINSLTVV